MIHQCEECGRQISENKEKCRTCSIREGEEKSGVCLLFKAKKPHHMVALWAFI